MWEQLSEVTPMCGSKPVDGGVSGRLGVLSGIWWHLGDPEKPCVQDAQKGQVFCSPPESVAWGWTGHYPSPPRNDLTEESCGRDLRT